MAIILEDPGLSDQNNLDPSVTICGDCMSCSIKAVVAALIEKEEGLPRNVQQYLRSCMLCNSRNGATQSYEIFTFFSFIELENP